MKITRRQLRKIIREERHRISESGRENVSGSLGELIRIASDAIHTADGDTDLAFDDLWNDSQVTDFIEQVLSDRGAAFTDSEISYLLQAATDIASMVIDGSYNSSQAHAELSSEFDSVSGGGR